LTDCTFTERPACSSQPTVPYLKNHSLPLESWNSWYLSWCGAQLFCGESFLCLFDLFTFFFSPTFHSTQDWSTSTICQAVAGELVYGRTGYALSALHLLLQVRWVFLNSLARPFPPLQLVVSLIKQRAHSAGTWSCCCYGELWLALEVGRLQLSVSLDWLTTNFHSTQYGFFNLV